MKNVVYPTTVRLEKRLQVFSFSLKKGSRYFQRNTENFKRAAVLIPWENNNKPMERFQRLKFRYLHILRTLFL